jgi:DNA-binding transcriptional regulator of glucitol operon
VSNLGKIFILIGIMWFFQLWFAYKQSKIFQEDIRSLRKQGTLAVGMGGRRYRGGRAFVALTADDNGIVKDGLVLRGFTVLARSKRLSAYTGFSIKEIASGDRIAEGEKRKVQEAATNSAQFILDHFERVKTGGE